MADETPEAPETEAPRMKRRRLPLIIVGVLVLTLAVWGIHRYLYSRHHVSTDNAQVDAHITLIAPRVAAFVSKVLVDDNQHVDAGDTLVILDDRDLKVKLEQAEAEAAVDNAQLQLSYTYITAPISGTIARRNAESGALVQVGQTLMSIVPDGDVWVTANLKETQLAHIQVGDRVKFTVDAYAGRDFEGRVVSLSPATGARFAL